MKSSSVDRVRFVPTVARRARFLAVVSVCALFALQPHTAPAQVNVWTYHYDNARTGQNTNETILNLANVNTNSFGKLFTQPVDGYVYAQPLYVAGVTVTNKGLHNVIFIATEHDSVYAFDADDNNGPNAAPLWHTNFTNPAAGITTVPSGDVGSADIVPEIGITSTPVIDLSTGTIYVEAKTKQVVGVTTSYHHHLHALDIASGVERTNRLIAASVSGSGDGNDGAGHVPFNDLRQMNRPGLLLHNGVIYIAYASHGDNGPYHGWVLGYNAQTLQQVAVYNTCPNGGLAGIWMSGNGPAIDASGYMYFETGNGTFNTNYASFTNYSLGDSFVKLQTTNRLSLADYFTPFNEAALNGADTDLGSGGNMVLPDSVGSISHPHLLVGCGKEGKVYLLDRDNMGHFRATDDSQILQELPGAVGGTWSSPAFFNGRIYYLGSGDHIKAFRMSGGLIVTSPESQGTHSYGFPGATPTISANGVNDGIVWTLETAAQAVLHAYNAANVAVELYNSSLVPSRDNPGPYVKFTLPIVANGKVYVGTQNGFSAFGVSGSFVNTPIITPNGGVFTNSVTVSLATTTVGATIYYTLDNTVPTTSSILYAGPFMVTNTTIVQAKAFKTGSVASPVASAAFTSYFDVPALLVSTGSVWKYLDNNTDQGTAWRAPGFNDSAWVSGPAPLGYGDANGIIPATITSYVPDPPNKYITTYFRRAFNVADASPFTNFTVVIQRDDGAVVYLNGVEVFRSNMPGGAISNNTFAATVVGGADESAFYSNNFAPGVLITGANVFAVEIHQANVTSTDIFFDLELFGFARHNPPVVNLTSPTNGAVFTAPVDITLRANATESNGTITKVEFFQGATKLGETNSQPYALTWASVGAGQYALTAKATDNQGVAATSSAVNIRVTAPALRAAYSSGKLTISWAASSVVYVLEYTDRLAPPVSWTPATQVPATMNGVTSVTIPVGAGTRFFRLRPPP